MASPLHSRILAEVLEGWGIEPFLAADGRIAMDALDRSRREWRPFPLVLLEIGMLEPSGATLAGRIRDEPSLAGSVVLMASVADRRPIGGSGPGLGATSILQRPIRQAELLDAILATIGVTPPTWRRPAPPADHGDPTEKGRPLRILLVEDNPFNRRVASLMLQKHGDEIVIATNGKEALDLAIRDPFDLILMDVQMPVMDGIEATIAIRAAEAGTGRHLPIIAMTAHAMKEDRDRCLEAGMDDFLTKPVLQDKLWSVITARVGTPRTNTECRPKKLEAARMMDVETALERVGGDRSFLAEQVALFLLDCPRLMEGIGLAITQGDASRVRADTHILKNWIGNFVAPTVFEATMAMEAIGHGGDLSVAEAAYATLEREINGLRPELAQFISSLAG